MIRRVSFRSVSAVFFALLAAPLVPSSAEAQDGGRFRVLVPDFVPEGGADRRFGERVAERVSRLIDAYDTHQPVAARDYQRALRDNKLNRQEMTCISARQLASLMQAQLVICGSYAPAADGFAVNATVYSVGTQESFEISPTTVPARNGEDAAAQHFDGDFRRFVQQERLAFLCRTYYESQTWDNAMSNCGQALELAPNAIGPRMIRGLVHREEGRLDEALADFEGVLERDPFNQTALQNAAYTAGRVGDGAKSLKYYQEFLELDPDNDRVRMVVAYELANEIGDAAGAMALLEEGVQRSPDNVELWERLGAAAFRAATVASQEAGTTDENMPAEARAAYEKALQAFDKVFEIKGAETDPALLANSIRTYVALGDAARGVQFAERVVQSAGDNASIRQAYATALQRSGDLAGAVRELDAAKRIDPNLPNVAVMQGQWLFQSGDYDNGFTYIQEAVRNGEQTAEAMAQFLFGQAWNNGLNGNRNLALGISLIEKAKQLPIQDSNVRSQMDFWHGFGLFNQAIPLQEPNTLPSAQRTLPMFQEALRLFQSGQAWATSPASPVRANYAQYVANAQEFIEIQQLIVRRGR